MKKVLKEIVSNYLQTNITISQKGLTGRVMEKKLFIESILLLREIEDRKDFMESELGVDMSVYEEKFLQVIENLFRMNYNKEQMDLIQYYLYQIPLVDEYDGKIDLSDGKNIVTVKFETPEDVYNVVTSLKKPEKKFGRKE
jgi:hypothetical protein